MRDLDPQGVLDEALAQMATTPDPRLHEIMAAAVRHLHGFAREVQLKPDEWLAGIAFLTAVGQACTPIGRSSSYCPTCSASPAWST
ncbi:dioxygenase [Siccirubricoccus deserti]